MYGETFYDEIRAGAQQSARTAVPVLARLLDLDGSERIIDVGCGEGWWADAFAALGHNVVGLDSGETDHRPTSFQFVDHDLTDPFPNLGRFDVAVSLEVAEHLPPEHASTFVYELCRLAPIVVFSAAIPGQGGTNHINEQWPNYWSDLFTCEGFDVSGAARWHLWHVDGIENWYQQNLLVASGPDARPLPTLFADELAARPISVVHPILYEARRHP